MPSALCIDGVQLRLSVTQMQYVGVNTSQQRTRHFDRSALLEHAAKGAHLTDSVLSSID